MDRPHRPQEVTLSPDVRMEGDNIYVEITTNLPEQTRLILTITDEIGSVYSQGKTLARVRTEVVDGTVVAGPFDVGKRPYPHGEYRLRIWTTAMQLQPVSVQKAITERGGLAGDCVVDGRVFVEKTFAVLGMSDW